MSVQQVDAALLNRSGDLLAEACSERASVDDFLERSFGLALLHEDEIVGWCLSEYNLDHRCEVGIAVVPSYQQRGLATALGTAFANEAHSRGITEIGWHCWVDNEASLRTAQRLGFRRVGTLLATVVTTVAPSVMHPGSHSDRSAVRID
jgi:GNAT superfamily N-acetyltransferase